jgi:hypothetical protein
MTPLKTLDLSKLPPRLLGLSILFLMFTFVQIDPSTQSHFRTAFAHAWTGSLTAVSGSRTDLGSPANVLSVSSAPPSVVFVGVSPYPTGTGTPVTLYFNITGSTTLTGVAVDWGDGTITHPSLTATSDTHAYANTGYLQSETFTINVTATSSSGQASGAVSEIVRDRVPTLTFFNLSPSPATVGQSVALKFGVSDPDGTVWATWVDWGDGSVPDLILNETSSSMCQRLNPGLNSAACTLAPGDLLFSSPPKAPAAIMNGTIIIFRPYFLQPDYLIAHRVIKIIPATASIYTQITFWTKGDANTVPDGWDQPGGGIPANQVVAVYQYTISPTAYPANRYDNHTYTRAGSYTIAVNATDNSQSTSSISTAPITVSNPSTTILGLTPVEFYAIIGVAIVAAAAGIVAFKRARKDRLG